jgi:hypothetical protein
MIVRPWMLAPAVVIVAIVAAILVLSRQPASVVQVPSAPPHDLPVAATAAAPSVSAPPAPVVSALPSAPLPAPAAMSEGDLMTELRADADSNPTRALALAQDAERRFPDSQYAPEYEMIKIKALYKLDRPSEGRGAAEKMVNQYPGNPFANEVEKHTGAHPHVPH